jgi:hypothetical protein
MTPVTFLVDSGQNITGADSSAMIQFSTANYHSTIASYNPTRWAGKEGLPRDLTVPTPVMIKRKASKVAIVAYFRLR